MKKVIISLLVLIPFFGFNQIMNHFDNLGSKWYVASNFINANQENPSHLGVKTKIWGFKGDTLIDNQNWMKMYSSQDTTFQNNLVFHGFLRSEDSKVYYKETDTTSSQQLYDFSMEVGDSAEYKFELWEETHTAWLKVIQIDTININGYPYKRFKFSNHLPDGFPLTMGTILKEVWIEGIGSLRNPIFPAKPFTLDSEWGEKVDLTCSFINEIQYYHDENYSECYVYDVLNVQQLQRNYVEIYPNPAENDINIITTEDGIYDIELINSLGNIIHTKQLSGTNDTVNMNEFKSGIYFLKIIHNNNFQTIKILKK